MRILPLGVLAAWALVALPAATAKDFRPGDLRVCDARRCVPVTKPQVLSELPSFYGSGPKLTRVARPPLRTPYYKLRFRNGYVTGIVATRRVDRFLSYGVNVDRFERDAWYRVPRNISRELRRLTTNLRPLTLNRAALAKSR